MNKPAQILNTRVKTRCCPGCGYVMSQVLIEYARFDYPCPKCEEYTIDQFQIVEWEHKGGDST